MNSLSFDSPERKSSSTLTEAQQKAEERKVRSNLVRARMAGTSATLTLEQWFKILDHYEWLCAYCREWPYQILEHCIPVSVGGGTTAENCVPACRSCNNRKKAHSAIHDEATQSFRFEPVLPCSPRTVRKHQNHLRKIKPMEQVQTPAIAQAHLTMNLARAQTETIDRWMSEDEILEELGRLFPANEEPTKMLSYLVALGMIMRTVITEGVRYRFLYHRKFTFSREFHRK